MGVFLALAAARGADFSGIWTGTMADRNGDLQDVSFRFEQHGGLLTGKMYGDNESVPIEGGAVDREEIRFTVTTELNGSISRNVYSGRLTGGQIQLTRERAGANLTGVNPTKDKPNPKQAIALKRL